MFLKKCAAMLLALILLLPSLALTEDKPVYQPGDTVELTFTVTDNPNSAVAAMLKLEYDHSVFELIPSSFVQSDAIISLNINGIPVGDTIAVSLLVLQGAPGGEYDIKILVEQAGDINENDVDGFAFSSCRVKITSALEQAYAEMEAMQREMELLKLEMEELKQENELLLEENDTLAQELEAERASATEPPSPEADYQFYIEIGKATIEKYIGSGGDVVIPDRLNGYPVWAIGEEAFSNCDSLTSITIPDSIVSIGNKAFNGCSNLTSITIPDGVTSISDGAFASCGSLTSITIPGSVTSIGRWAFSGCSSLTSITIPSSVTSIGYMAFDECSSLASITIPSSVTSIEFRLFAECTSLTSVTIPNSVRSIAQSAFYHCTSLTSITIPDSVTQIDDYVFTNSANLTSVTIPKSVAYIGYFSFFGCSPNLVIHGAKGSYAQKYCKEHDLQFQAQ